MKRIALLFAAVAACLSASAQGEYITRTGVVEENGTLRLVEPRSTIAVDITVERTEIIVGPYARFAQKYLGVRAPLSDKDSYRITGASIKLLADNEFAAPAQVAAPTEQVAPQSGDIREFARLLPDRMDSRALTSDQAAAEAAEAIFSLRKHRIELITGEAGENVFGAGLAAALKEIDAYETAYLELFFGRRITSTQTVRMTVMPSNDKFGYILARFSEKDGLIPASDLSGEIVILQIEPSGDTSLRYLHEAGPKDKQTIDCRLADFSTCILSCGSTPVTRTVLPLFEYGRDIKIVK